MLSTVAIVDYAVLLLYVCARLSTELEKGSVQSTLSLKVHCVDIVCYAKLSYRYRTVSSVCVFSV
jgi:hypothetical protein